MLGFTTLSWQIFTSGSPLGMAIACLLPTFLLLYMLTRRPDFLILLVSTVLYLLPFVIK
jgi:hypothetical protein